MTDFENASAGNGTAQGTVRLGRISYLNVLPIYYAVEHGHVSHDFSFAYGPPAELNTRMAAGELDISSASSIEYARHFQDYLLLPDLAIGSQGPVQSVLLLSQVPVTSLEGFEILISSQTHTSAALLRLLMRERLGLHVQYTAGDITAKLAAGEPPAAFLAIGDEALRLRSHTLFPYQLDLGQAWLEWTGLPFIFGVWIVRRDGKGASDRDLALGCRGLLESKDWGLERIPFFARLISDQGILSYPALVSYFQGLVYDLGPREQDGLRLFYRKLYEGGEIGVVPELNFIAIPSGRE